MIRSVVLAVAIAICVHSVVLGDDVAPPTLADVARRWVAATGGDKNLRRIASASLRADGVEDGVADSVTERVARDGFSRITIEQADTRVESCAARSAWLVDWNGHLRTLAGRDRADQRAEAAIDALLYAGGARGISEAAAQLAGEDDTHASYVVHFSPEDTTPFDVFVDKATALPVKIVRKPYDDTITLTPSDWRVVAGVKVPYALRETGGENDATNTLAVKEYLPSRNGPRPPFGPPKAGAKDVVFATGRSALAIPFNFENDHIMIDGRVNGGEPLWFLLDTGAEATIINKPRMAEFGLVPFGASSIEGGGNATDFSFTKVDRLSFPGVELAGQRDGVIDLSGLEKIYGHGMGGILGYDFLSRFVVRVDYDKKTVDLLDPSGFVYTGSGKSVPFIIEAGHPHVPSTITVPSSPKIPADMVIDSGAADTVNLTSPFVKANHLVELARKTPAGAPNVLAGSEKEFFAQTSVRGRLSTFTLGPFTLTDIPNNLMVATTGGYAAASFSGTIGEGVLHRFNAVYDYARDAIVLEPNGDFEKPFPPRKTFGATFLSEGADYKVFRVTAVRKDSPAEAAGFQKGDIVVAVDGKSAAELTLAELRKLLTADGAKHALTLRRGDTTVDVELVVATVSLDD